MDNTCAATKKTWKETMRAWTRPQVLTMLLLGFSAGVPILLIFSTLGLWLREAGVSRSAVTFFSWAALAYSFKFVWAPLIDTLPFPFLTKKLGRRRGWLLVAQIAIITAICGMALTDPAAGGQNLVIMALAAVLLGFSSATQDIVIDAYRIECAEQELQALLASTYIVGYRIGMVVAGAGALYLADWFGAARDAYNYAAWQYSYFAMALVMLIGVATTLAMKEPETGKRDFAYSASHYLRFLFIFACGATVFVGVFFLSAPLVADIKNSVNGRLPGHINLIGFGVEAARLFTAISCAFLTGAGLAVLKVADREMVREAYVRPAADFFQRRGVRTALLLLALIGVYRISDIVLGVISNVFYQDLGFSKTVIASVIKTFGMFMTIAGGILGGVLTLRYGVIKILFLGALLSSATNLLFMLLATTGDSVPLLTVVIAADNLSAGIAATAFVAFLSSLTSISFTATQYAIFSSLMTLFPKLIGGYSGTMVENWGYELFFLVTAVIGLPVLLLVWLAGRKLR